MPALALNGIEVPVLLGSISTLEPERIGERGRSARGRDFDSVRARKWGGLRARLAPLPPDESEAWRSLIGGCADAWRFDADPLPSVRGAQWTKESAFGVFVSSGSIPPWDVYGFCSGWYYYPAAAPPNSWTIIARYFYNGTWTAGVLRRSDGQWFRGGSPYTPAPYEDMSALDFDEATGRLKVRAKIKADGSAAHPLWLPATLYIAGDKVRNSLNGGSDLYFECVVGGTSGGVEPVFNRPIGSTTIDNTVTWRSLGEWPTRIADMALLQFSVPDSWAPVIEAEHDARIWSCPFLRATGDLVPGAPRTVVGRVLGSSPSPFASGGALQLAAESVEFELREA